MRVLIAVPSARVIPRSITSILALETPGGADVRFMRGGDVKDAHPYDNITRKCEALRKLTLDGGYDAALFTDDDQILPPDALVRLEAVGAPVAYGLTVLRHELPAWTAALRLEGHTDWTPLSDDPKAARKAWGKTIEVKGCGMFCTLIRRDVLERVTFHRDGVACCDWYFALDCQTLGVTQKADLGVVCGHVRADGAALWPDKKEIVRVEQ